MSKPRSLILLTSMTFTLALIAGGFIFRPLTAEQSVALAVTSDGNVLTVDSTSDGEDLNPGDGFCQDAAGQCTLRAAIMESNSLAGKDTIAFEISGDGPHTIQPATGLPEITDPVIIDGYTQPGSSANTAPARQGLNTVLKIELDGSQIEGIYRNGLVVSCGDSLVRGLVINRFSSGIMLNIADNNVVEGNFIGTDVTGMAALPNFLGVETFNYPDNNTIGGPTPASRNLISGNQTGISLSGGSNNVIQGNLIGTNKNGEGDLGNDFYSVRLEGSGQNTIADNVVANDGTGGIIVWSGERNVIRDNTVRANRRQEGIALIGPSVAGSQITGNLVVGNDRHGIIISKGSEPIAVTQNVVIQNGGHGMSLSGSGISVYANYIGTDQAANELGNQQAGIYIYGGSDNKIGDPSNIIANNLGNGITVRSGENHDLADNIIYNNGGLGIDLGEDGPTANDPLDDDSGPNNLQNYPVLTGAVSTGNVITGTLLSQPDSQFEVDFFANRRCNTSGYGEGEELLGRIIVTTDSSGAAVFSAAYPSAPPDSRVITALATNQAGNTSEFSRCRFFDQSRSLLPLILNRFCDTFIDYFNNPASGWPIGESASVRYGYLAGEYQVFTKNPDYYYVFRSPSCERENYAIEADARWASTPGAGYGLVFGITENYGRYYLFNVNANAGQYSLYRKDGPGFITTLVWPTDSAAINVGSASNHLRVTRSDGQITLEVNGTLVHEMYDSRISGSTGAGIAVIPYLDLPNADARFDNFLSKDISQMEPGSEPAANTAAIPVELGALLPKEWIEGLSE